MLFAAFASLCSHGNTITPLAYPNRINTSTDAKNGVLSLALSISLVEP